MWKKLQQYFMGRRFYAVDLHMEHMALYYIAEGVAASLVWILDEKAVDTLTQEQYRQYSETIRGIFLKRGLTMVSMLSLFLTSDIAKVRQTADGTMYWIVDENYGRLVVYENQPEEFLGLRGMIENNLRFGGESRNSDGVQRSANEDNLRNACCMQGEKEREEKYRAYARRQQKERFFGWMRRWKERDWCVFLLIAVNLAVFLLTDLIEVEWLLMKGSLSWYSVLEEGQWWRVLTSMFLHWDLSHIANNMLVLYGLGSLVERRFGHGRFLVLYFLSGLGASVLSMSYHWRMGEYALSAGASGAIYGIAGAVVAMLLFEYRSRGRENVIRVVIFLFFLFASVFMGDTGTDNAAHIGGFVVGVIFYHVANWFERRRRRKRNFY